MTGRQAWALMAAGIVTYEVFAARQGAGQLLSEVCDEWLVSHPVTTRAIVAGVALHLINGLPTAVDPIHLLHVGIARGAKLFA